MPAKKKIIIIGAGPGGLTAGLLLSHNPNFEVEIYEQLDQPGGRNSELKEGGYCFDVGPTFFMMPQIFNKIFEQIGKDPADYLDFIRLKPMYRLILNDDRQINVYDDKILMKKELERVFGNNESAGLEIMHKVEKDRFERLFPILSHDNNSWFYFFNPEFWKQIPAFNVGRSVYAQISRYFKQEMAKMSFTFQAKYFGMSPWNCPAAFTFVSYIEQAFGVYHVLGGLSEISRQMARIIQDQGGKIYYNAPVSRVLVENKKAIGIELADGERKMADEVIINADFAYAAANLFSPGVLKKYSPAKMARKKYSAGVFMMYLGIKKKYNLPHNNIIFAHDYKKSVDVIFGDKVPGDDISFYVRDTSTTDSTVAPEGKSTLYILVPVPNKQTAPLDWQVEKPRMRKIVLDALKTRLGLEDIEEQVEVERILTPDDFSADYNVHYGAVFNLSHKILQMMWLRPHNKFEEINNCYLVGGGTHPGSGLPTIYQSGIIAAKLIAKKYS